MTSMASSRPVQAPGAGIRSWCRLTTAAASVACGLVLLAFSAGGSAAAEFGDHLHETKRVLRHTANECVDLTKRECVTVRSKRIVVPRRQAERIVVACPKRFPHVVGWDAEHNEYISLALISDLPAPGARPRPRAKPLEVSALNRADRRGFVVLHVGCSNKPFKGSSFPRMRDAVPSNHVGFGKGRAP